MNKKAIVLAAGDFCPINRTETAILEGRSIEMLSDIRNHIDESDVSVINLEVPLTDIGAPITKTGPNLISNPDCVEFLKKSGFNLINTANNHIMDYGKDGYIQTIGLLDSNKLRYVGSGINLKESRREEVFKIRGIKVAFLAFAENEYTTADINKPGACPVDVYSNSRDISRAADLYDHTIVLVHGGNEYNPIPSPGMKKRYRGYIEAGASAVIATHTHCPQGYEYHEGRPIVYSLGNFLFDSPYKDREYSSEDLWWKGYMIKLELDKTGLRISDFIPVDFGPDGTVVRELVGDEKETFLEYLEFISTILKDEEEALMYWKAWCLMKGQWWGEYIDKLTYPVDTTDPDKKKTALVMRNGLTCEAHNELLTTFWKMTAHEDTSGYDEYVKRIEIMQRGMIPMA